MYLHDTNVSIEELTRLTNDICNFHCKLHDASDISVIFTISDRGFNDLFHRINHIEKNGWNPINIVEIDRFFWITLDPNELLRIYLILKAAIKEDNVCCRGLDYTSDVDELIYNRIFKYFKTMLTWTYGLLEEIDTSMRLSGNEAKETRAFRTIDAFQKRVLDVLFMNIKLNKRDTIWDGQLNTNVCLIEDNSEELTKAVQKEFKLFLQEFPFIDICNAKFESVYEITEKDILVDFMCLSSLIYFTEFFEYNSNEIISKILGEEYKNGSKFVYARLYEQAYSYKLNAKQFKPVEDVKEDDWEQYTPEGRIKQACDIVWKYNTEESHHKQWIIDQMLKILLSNDEYKTYLQDYIKWYNNDHEDKVDESDPDLYTEIHGIAP